MAFLLPFHQLVPANHPQRFLTIRVQDDPDIPTDTYELHELYCPNPDCDCNEVFLKVVAVRQNLLIASIRIPLSRLQSPTLDPKFVPNPLALTFLRLISSHLLSDPAYSLTLREHYRFVKAIAADPSHPAFPTLHRWANSGSSLPSHHRKHKKGRSK